VKRKLALAVLTIILTNAFAEDFLYDAVEDGVEIERYTGASLDVSVPVTLGGQPVVSIGTEAFQNTTVTNVSFPATLRRIGYHPFYNSAIRSLTIPDDVTNLNQGAFLFCRDLETATIGNGVRELDNTFGECTKLASVDIGPNVTKVCAASAPCRLTLFPACINLSSPLRPRTSMIGPSQGIQVWRASTFLGIGR
jgi:hypothetical protein